MEQQLASLAPEQVKVSLPRKDVVQLEISWRKWKGFFIYALAMLFWMAIIVWLFVSFFSTAYPFWIILKVAFSAFCVLMVSQALQRVQVMLFGMSKITITPKEIQHQLYKQQKEWGDLQQVSWRNMQGFTTELPTANEISITGDPTPNERLRQHLNWQQLQELRKWMAYYFKSFNAYYTEEQIRYIEQWAAIQYEHYNRNPQVDELEVDYFLKETEPLGLEIDLSEHLIDDSKL
jgi:Fe2+ transport system protein B